MNSELSQNITHLLNEKYNGVETPEFFLDVERLKAGEPYAYILGWKDFLGVHIDLSCKPIIPRAETAHWALRAIEELKAKQVELGRPLRTFDAYAGSGNVGLAVAKHIPGTFVEISELDANLSPGIIASARPRRDCDYSVFRRRRRPTLARGRPEWRRSRARGIQKYLRCR